MRERVGEQPHEVREPEAGRADTRAIAEVARILQKRRRLKKPLRTRPDRQP